MKHLPRLRAHRAIVFPCLSATSLLAALACQDVPQRELGYTDDAQNLTTTPEQPSEPFVSNISDFSGRWIGEADEALAFGTGIDDTPPVYHFPSGSALIALDFGTLPRPEDNETGVLTFGAGTPPPAPVDADVGYPSDVDYGSVISYFEQDIPTLIFERRPLPPYEGFAYTLRRPLYSIDTPPSELAGDLEDPLAHVLPDGVLVLTFNTEELLQPWCELQTPFAVGEASATGYSCVPGTGIHSDNDGCSLLVPGDHSACPLEDPDSLSFDEYNELYDNEPDTFAACYGDESVPVDCNKANLCYQQRCACDASSCWAGASDSPSQASLTLRRTGEGLLGVFDGAVFLNQRGLRAPLGTVRFRPAP
jgi:hypothetical protein